MSQYYPLYLHLVGQLCLVVGGGAVAERKAIGLRDAGARVRVVAPELSPGLQRQAEAGEIEVILAPYSVAFLQDGSKSGEESSTSDGGAARGLVRLVFAATNKREVNAQVTADAQARGILASVADAPDEGDFITPSVLRRGDLCLSVSTGGSHPALAARISDELAERYGPEYGDWVELLGQMRAYIKAATPDSRLRRDALRRLIEPDAESVLREHLRTGDRDAARAQAEAWTEAILRGE